MMPGIFNLLNAFFVGMTTFLDKHSNGVGSNRTGKHSATVVAACPLQTRPSLPSLLKGSQLIVPAVIAALSWAIIAMPMSVVRVAMPEMGFSSRQILLTIELLLVHFLGCLFPWSAIQW